MIIYSKYNRSRLPKFQIQTSIKIDQNGEKCVIKKALSSLAISHIVNIYNNSNFVSKKIDFIKTAKVSLDGDQIVFEYIKGVSFDEKLFKSIENKNEEEFYNHLKDYKELINNWYKHFSERTVEGINIDEIFIDVYKNFNKNYTEVRLVNIDFTFENILRDKSNYYYVIDNEWLYKTSVPIEYIVYRACSIFFIRYSPLVEDFVNLEKILKFFNISKEDINFYQELEKSFQAYVTGAGNYYSIPHRYFKQHLNLEDYKDLITKEFNECILAKNQLIVKCNNLTREFENNQLALTKKEEELKGVSNELSRSKDLLKNNELELRKIKNEMAEMKNTKTWKIATMIHKIKLKILR